MLVWWFAHADREGRMDELRVNIVKRMKYDNVFRVQDNDFLDIFQKKMFCDLFFL